MARYTVQYQFDGRYTDIVFNEIKNYLEYEGFQYVDYKGEYVFQKGEGWFVAPTFVKVGFSRNLMQLETWLKYSLLPGIFVGEIGLEGFVGAAVKGAMKRAVANIPSIVARYPLMQTNQPVQGYSDSQILNSASPIQTIPTQPPQPIDNPENR